MFFVVFFSTFTALNLYLGLRLAHLPAVHARLNPWATVGVVMLLAWSFPLARFLLADRLPTLSRFFEYVGAMWMGVFLLLLTCLLIVEVLTLGGFVLRGLAPQLRAGAFVVGALLSVFAAYQARRPVVVTRYDVALPGLPAALEGKRLAVISDLHLGNIIGEAWLKRTIGQIDAEKPDAVLMVGDIVDSDPRPVEPLQPLLSTLKAPLGVYAVMGNHEYYAGDVACAGILERSGIQVLRNRHVSPVPGLVFAGIDDLTVAGYNPSVDQKAMLRAALDQRPAGGTVLLSHTPLRMQEASELGAGLMVSGHTHNGQIWPFNYLVKRRYPTVYGEYHYNAMTLLVSRGSGTWGPRMRLWSPGELVLVTLRTAK